MVAAAAAAPPCVLPAPTAVDAEFDRRPGGQHDVVLVLAHHVGALAAQHADAPGRGRSGCGSPCRPGIRLETAPASRSRRSGRPCCLAHVAVGENVALVHIFPVADRRDRPAWCRSMFWGSSCGCRRRPGSRAQTMGATSLTAGHWRRISSMSVGVKRLHGAGAEVDAAGDGRSPAESARLFAPMLAMALCKAILEPWPISVMAMTAATPMMTPSAVRAERILFRRRAVNAVRNVAGNSTDASDAATSLRRAAARSLTARHGLRLPLRPAARLDGAGGHPDRQPLCHGSGSVFRRRLPRSWIGDFDAAVPSTFVFGSERIGDGWGWRSAAPSRAAGACVASSSISPSEMRIVRWA